eukprot:TRINITY_DN1474_c0_g1_i1.p2 TRINITY_DN1474_c0_g1~~TRINITY_DN1474_c0_g1_i1.p2  ORF type:complete len:138 (-),score=33.71 TRINITY_DN1474_c0_g1_i1:817-1230(-)
MDWRYRTREVRRAGGGRRGERGWYERRWERGRGGEEGRRKEEPEGGAGERRKHGTRVGEEEDEGGVGEEKWKKEENPPTEVPSCLNSISYRKIIIFAQSFSLISTPPVSLAGWLATELEAVHVVHLFSASLRLESFG